MFPPDGCIRVVLNGSTTVNKNTTLDHSHLELRDGQLDESYEAAHGKVRFGQSMLHDLGSQPIASSTT